MKVLVDYSIQMIKMFKCPKCPNCKKELKRVWETEYSTYEFDEKTGTYKENSFGDMEMRCPNCENKLDIFPDGVCNQSD
ncbi:MAG: hypothetical protein ACE5K4_10975 [Candidatus Hydrothermarchaeota archaeon]